MKLKTYCAITGLVLLASTVTPRSHAQASPEFMELSAPSPATHVEVVKYVNVFDGSAGEAMLEIPPSVLHDPKHRVPLILTSNPAGWTQEANRCLWTGIADKFEVMILYPRGQDSLEPNASLGAPRQIVNLQSALLAAEKIYPVDINRVYAAGLSQGALEALLMAAKHPGQFAGVLAINPIIDFIAFYQDLVGAAAPGIPAVDPGTASKAALGQLIAKKINGTPDTARAAYYERSPIAYSAELARVPLILYWASDDEIIPNGETHQGAVLAGLLRSANAATFEEKKHTGGHGYPFFHGKATPPYVELLPAEIFQGSVTKLLSWRLSEADLSKNRVR